MKCLVFYRGIILVAVTAFVCLAFTSIVRADATVSPGWIGGGSEANIQIDNDLSRAKSCKDKQINVALTDRKPSEPYIMMTTACVYANGGTEYTSSYRLPSGQGGAAIKLQGDDYFRKLGDREGIYSPITDVLLYGAGDSTQLKVVRNLSESVVLSDDIQGELTRYVIPSTAEERLPSTKSGFYYSTTAYAISESGRYVAAYVDYKGIIKIDLQTGEETSVLKYIGSWISGPRSMKPRAVSDDGRFIAIGPSLKVLDTQDCGWSVGGVFNDPFNHDEWCEMEDFTQRTRSLVGYEYTINYARFTDNDYTVEFMAEKMPGVQISGPADSKHLTVKVGPSKRVKLDYLALGDSYSSGEGDVDNDGFWYKKGTEKDKQCHLSLRSYPYLLRNAWNIQDNKMASVACSGALLGQDYTSPQDSYNGQHAETKDISEQEKDNVRNNALENYMPGIVPQLEFVKKYKPKVVTITASGNDVGFADILKYCASDLAEAVAYNYSCEYVKGGPLNQLLTDAIDTQYTKIIELIAELKRASPGVKIYYVGYPSFIGGSHTNCFMTNSGILDGREREMINDAVQLLNNVIKNAAAAGGAQYVDIETALNGGRLCEGSEYVTGIWATGVVDVLQGRTQEAFHPNSKGHEKIKQSIVAQVANPISAYQPTAPNVITIEPTTPTSRARIVKDPDLNGEEMLEITLEPNSTPGSSDIFVAAFSERVELGSYKSNEDGSFDAKIKLPSSLPNGTHLILLEIYQDGTLLNRIYDFITLTQNVDNHKPTTSTPVQSDSLRKSDNPSGEILGMTKSNNLLEPDLTDPNTHTLGSATNDVVSNPNDSKNNNNVFIIVTSCILFLCAAIVCIKKWQNR